MDQKQKVLQYIDEHRHELVDLLKAMVSYPTINDGGALGEEKAMQDFLAARMRVDGFDEVKQFAYDEEQKRPNILGVMKGSGGKSLMFNGHSDVVPVVYEDRWIYPPFQPTESEGRIYGRGTSDMKGGIAGAYFAMLALKRCGVRCKGDLMLLSAVGEESQSAETLGTERVVKEGYHPDFAVCCEPTGLEIHVASSALVFFKLIVEGKGVHVSARNQMLFPQGGGLASGDEIAVDAFRKSLPLVEYLSRLEVEWNHRYRDPVMGFGGKPSHDQQGVGVFTMNPAEIRGGEYLGTVPSRMEYTYSIWYPDQLVSRDEILDEIRRGVAAIASTDDWLRAHPPVIEAPVIQDWPGFHLDENHPGVQTLRDSATGVLGRDAILSGFKAVCDAYYTNRQGIPSVILGPGAISNAVHGDNEFIIVEDLIQAAKIYAAFAIDWCGLDS